MSRRNNNENRTSSKDEGAAIGLTRAFDPVSDDAYFDGVIPTDPFDEDGPFEAPAEAQAADDDDEGWQRVIPSDAPKPPEGVAPLTEKDYARAAHAAGKPSSQAKRGRHARHAAHASASEKEKGGLAVEAASGQTGFTAPSVFEEDSEPEKVPEYLRKSHRMRRILIVMIVIALALVVAGGVAVWQLIGLSHEAAVQQTQTTQSAAQDIVEANENDSQSTAKQTTVPSLTSLLGKTLDESIAQLQHGAQVSSTREINEEGNPIKSETRVALTAEPADARSGTPTVYLGFNEEGKVIQAGYSAATSALGYGSLSFADAVRNESVIEKTLNEAGVTLAVGTVQLPADKMAYSTYATDGTTLTREYCSFEGAAGDNGANYAWSAALSYDYSMANATGNLADTIRTVYVYVKSF